MSHKFTKEKICAAKANAFFTALPTVNNTATIYFIISRR